MDAHLRAVLEQAQLEYWFDHNIVETQENDQWWEEIARQIDKSTYFVFLFTKEWQNSTICRKELAIAEHLKKELIPIRIDDFEFVRELLYIPAQVQILDTFERDGRTRLLQRFLNASERAKRRQNAEKNTSESSNTPGIQSYCSEIAERNRRIKVLGRGDPFDLKEIFLNVRLEPLTGYSKIEIPVDDLISVNTRNKILIVGGPGTGKSTMLQYLQLQSADNSCVFFPIRTAFRNLASRGRPLLDWIEDYLKGQMGINLEFFRQTEIGVRPRLLLLLDGLDEIGDSDYDRLTKELLRFSDAWPMVRTIVTTRPTGFKSIDLAEFESFGLLPLRETEMRGYVERVVPDHDVERVWNTITSHPRIYDLASTPFLLALIAAAYEHLGPRATQRASLFRTCIGYLLRVDDWDATRDRIGRREADDLLKVLKFIAVRFFKLDYGDNFSKTEIIQNISLLPGFQTQAERVLQEIVETTGLLQFDRDGYQFVHRSIWEYLVAEGCRDEPVNLLVERANSRQWEEPIRLYVGLTPAASLEEVLSELWKRNATLALRAMTETQNFPDEILQKLYSRADLLSRMRVNHELKATIALLSTPAEKQRVLVDTAASIIRCETDCELLHYLISMLREFNSSECEGIAARILDEGHIDARLAQYTSEPKFKLSFVFIKGGDLTMGCDKREDGSPADASERPAHQVSVNDFWICQYLTTNSLYYDAFPFATERRNEYSHEPEQPVNMVNWFEARIFCWWLGCDLPTDAEWEYAARAAGADDAALTNPKLLPDYAWHGDNSQNHAHPVGAKLPNSFGLFDVAGNLREWCADWYGEGYYEHCSSLGIVSNPMGPEYGQYKVLRGGTFDWALTHLRPTYRNFNTPNNRHHVTGFRIVLRDVNVAKLLGLEGA